MKNKLNNLRLILGLFFLALAIPTTILIYQALSQMKWEAFRQHQVMAEELSTRIDKRLNQLIAEEEKRSFADYAFLNIAGNMRNNILQRSPLSTFPVEANLPGVLGYFQVDAEGEFSTPLLPAQGSEQSFGINQDEKQQRMALQQRIQQILSQNQLVKQTKKDRQPARKNEVMALSPSPATDIVAAPDLSGIMVEEEIDSDTAQAAFDSLERRDDSSQREQRITQSLGRVEELKLKSQFEQQARSAPIESSKQIFLDEKRAVRKEQTMLPEPLQTAPVMAKAITSAEQQTIRITTFESELDPFSFSQLDSGHFVLFRKVWRNGARYTQGILFDQQAFVQNVIESAFKETVLSDMSNLVLAFQGEVLSVISGRSSRQLYSSAAELQGELLYQTRLSAPLAEVELIYSINRLPSGPGAKVVTWVTLILAIVLIGGCYLFYRLGKRQLTLAQQQQDFVSAVSHELKTPLTSIRMYGEMLREGWADETKKRQYYDYIFDESERLTRLINNVLQLARMNRHDMQIELTPVSVNEIMDTIRSKLTSQLEHSGFELKLIDDCKQSGEKIKIDLDLFTQIIINLVDNAIKFSRSAEIKQIEVHCSRRSKQSVIFRVRDYGPGIAKDQMKKIFQLFYRAENELTRQTVGTGIGLALVQQLARHMDAKVDVINRQPGAEFSIEFRLD